MRAWRFGWNLADPETIHEEVGAIVRAAKQTDGGDYADQNSRTDWLTLNHFVASSVNDKMVSLSNRDCSFFHLGNYALSEPMDSSAYSVAVLAGGQVDGTKLGIRRQGGDRRFVQRFAVSSVRDQNHAMQESLQHQNPLVTIAVRDAAFNDVVRVLPEFELRTIHFESESVVIWAMKASEQGIESGLIVRLWNPGTKPSRYELSVGDPFGSCRIVTHIETDVTDRKSELAVENGKASETLPAGGMRTLRWTRHG